MIGLKEILEATAARPVGFLGDEAFPAAWADSRKVTPGSLFCAVRGSSLDGHAFAGEALRRGAAAVLVDEVTDVSPRLEVADVRKALFDILASRRRAHLGPVAAITGSIGKTTTKDLLAAILSCRGPTYKTPGNLNSDVGVPLASFGWDPGQAFAVLEMAMRMPGEIRALAGAAPPDVGIVTFIGESHIGFLRSRDAIARAKAELLGGLPPDGWAVLNADDPFTDLLTLYAPRKLVRVGADSAADVRVRILQDRGLGGWRLALDGIEAEPLEIDIPWPGRGARVAVGLAAAAAGVLGISGDEIRRGIGALGTEEGRVRIREVGDVVVIDDTYNAAPESMEAALDLLRRSGASRRIAVLGDMLELGEFSGEAHRRVGRVAGRSADLLFLIGERSAEVAEGAQESGLGTERITMAADAEALLSALTACLAPGDTLLVKGSRALGLESVVEGVIGA